jgi:ketosteroid isomerase-like protein
VTVTPKAGGNAMTENGKYLVILKRQGDGPWLIHHEIGNSSEPMPAPAGQEASKQG